MSDTVITGPWKLRERKPDFGAIGKVVAMCGDAFDLGISAKSADPSLVMAFAAKLEQHAQNARLLAEEARTLNLTRIRFDLIQQAEHTERRSVELEAQFHDEE